MIQELLHGLVEVIHALGYPGVFIMTFLESTFMPIPSEVTMIPVGYLVHQGRMDLWAVLFLSISGTLSGSLFNYWIARHFGRWIFIRHGKYLFMTEEKLLWMEKYFESHGPISIFTGRLIPGVRHVISFPAGLSKMNLKKFCIYTALGGSIWVCILTSLGYFIGQNKALLEQYLSWIVWGLLTGLAVMVAFYVVKHRKKA